MSKRIPIELKRRCSELKEQGMPPRKIYEDYYAPEVESPMSYETFKRQLRMWRHKTFPDQVTLDRGTYEGFTAHGATVQVAANGEIVQAWIKQHKEDAFNVEGFLEALRGKVEQYDGPRGPSAFGSSMLEIPLFDMHWGIAYLDYYKPVLDEILSVIRSNIWDQIVIPFGQDFFHNDSVVNGVTSKGTSIEKVNMERAVKESQIFMYAIVDAAIENSNETRILYTPGNHDRSISWMFIQVLRERYGSEIVDDSIEYRKVATYGKNAVMFTHGDSKQASAKNLAHVFPITFPDEFANANVREVHAGHLHREGEADIYGVMVRRLSSGGRTDEWANREDYVGSHKRFMLFEWGFDKLKSIHYI